MAGSPRSWPLSPRGSDTKPHLLFLHRRLEVCPLDPQSDTGWLLSVHPGCLISPSLSSSCCSVPSKTNTLWVPIRWGYFNVHSSNKHNFTNSFNKTRTQLFYSTIKLGLHVKCTSMFTRYGRWYTWRQRAGRNVWVNALGVSRLLTPATRAELASGSCEYYILLLRVEYTGVRGKGDWWLEDGGGLLWMATLFTLTGGTLYWASANYLRRLHFTPFYPVSSLFVQSLSLILLTT